MANLTEACYYSVALDTLVFDYTLRTSLIISQVKSYMANIWQPTPVTFIPKPFYIAIIIIMILLHVTSNGH